MFWVSSTAVVHHGLPDGAHYQAVLLLSTISPGKVAIRGFNNS